MKAVILAGGRGTRLRPITYAIPKPLIPINQRPLLEHILIHLKNYGIKDFIFTVGYLGYQIKTYFGDGSSYGVNIEYAEEKEPLGTSGCLVPLKKKLDSTFLLFGGDNLTTMNVTEFVKFHKNKKAVVTTALTEISIPVKFGIVDMDKNNMIKNFREKPTFKHNAVTMIMCIEPKIFDYIPKGFSNITDHIFPKLLRDGCLYGYPFKDYWLDLGTYSDYKKLSANNKK